MALFRRLASSAGDPDPLNNYKGWSDTAVYSAGDVVLAVVCDPTENNTPQVRVFRCKSIPPAGVRPPRYPNDINGGTAASFPLENTYWIEDMPGGTDLVEDSIELLPDGIGLQTITDPTATYKGVLFDRYLRTGAILFDRQGNLEHLSYTITGTSVLGQRIGLPANGRIGFESAQYTLNSQIGVVLYENEPFLNQPGATEGDANPFARVPGVLNPPASQDDEIQEEIWLDNNATMLLVNRYSGELVRAR
jgi:hypothetical protein